MFQTLKNAWKITELRSKLLFTLLIIVLYRLGSVLPMPWVVGELNPGGASIFAWVDILSGGAFGHATLFALSVSPYITASIVIQLLTVAIPKFEEWSKEGEHGRKILSSITRYTTVALALVTSIGYTMMLNNTSGMLASVKGEGWKFFRSAALVLCFCAGASIVMWLAEKINEHGIGNGISIILFANIISGIPSIILSLVSIAFRKSATLFRTNEGMNGLSALVDGLDGWEIALGVVLSLVFMAILLVAVVFVIWFSNSERRIPVQYAKRVVGRKMYGGQSTNLPIKLNMSGVMPVIFASSIVSILPTVAGFFQEGNAFKGFVEDYLGPTSFPYIAFYLVLTIAFAYFYTMISFNPIEVSNNLRNNGGAIPGIRPGKPTVDYIKRILDRITLLGALFLCILCGLPMIVNAIYVHLPIAVDANGIGSVAYSGTSLLIVVGVALETFREIEAQMTLRNYKGFLD